MRAKRLWWIFVGYLPLAGYCLAKLAQVAIATMTASTEAVAFFVGLGLLFMVIALTSTLISLGKRLHTATKDGQK